MRTPTRTASYFPLLPGRKGREWLILAWQSGGLLELFCTCARRKRDRDGACEAQRWALDRYADPDWIGQTVLRHAPEASVVPPSIQTMAREVDG